MEALNCRTEPHSDNVENIDFPENDVGTAAHVAITLGTELTMSSNIASYQRSVH